MEYVDPMKDTPEGKILTILKQIEVAVGITKNPENENIEKYEQESSIDNIIPQFMEVSGTERIRASGFSTNQIMPYMGPSHTKEIISEVAKMPSVSQTGYDVNSSSLHMHLNDPGGVTDNISPIEDSLMDLKKQATIGQFGMIEEIAGLIEQVYARL